MLENGLISAELIDRPVQVGSEYFKNIPCKAQVMVSFRLNWTCKVCAYVLENSSDFKFSRYDVCVTI